MQIHKNPLLRGTHTYRTDSNCDGPTTQSDHGASSTPSSESTDPTATKPVGAPVVVTTASGTKVQLEVGKPLAEPTPPKTYDPNATRKGFLAKIKNHRFFEYWRNVPSLVALQGIKIEARGENDFGIIRKPTGTTDDYINQNIIIPVKLRLLRQHQDSFTLTRPEEILVSKLARDYIEGMHALSATINQFLEFYCQLLDHKARLYGFSGVLFSDPEVVARDSQNQLPYDLLTNPDIRDPQAAGLGYPTITQADITLLRIKQQSQLRAAAEKLEEILERFLLGKDAKDNIIMLQYGNDKLSKPPLDSVHRTDALFQIAFELEERGALEAHKQASIYKNMHLRGELTQCNTPGRHVGKYYRECLLDKPFDQLYIDETEARMFGIRSILVKTLSWIQSNIAGFVFDPDTYNEKWFKSTPYYVKPQVIGSAS